MKKFSLFIAFAIVASMAVAQQRTERLEYQESSARNLEPEQAVMIAPMIADIKIVADKIYYTEKEAFKNYQVSSSIVALVPEFKKIALSRAARAYKADAIVGATVDVITNENGTLEITISGYPACYTNFRNATSEDITLVEQAKRVSGNNNEDILKNPKNRTNLTIEK